MFSRLRTIDVELPVGQVVKWPPMCVECGAEDPDSAYKCAHGWWLGALPLRRKTVKVPACLACARKMRRQKWFEHIQVVLIALLAAGAVALLLWALGFELSRSYWKLLVLVVAVGVLCVLPGPPLRVDITLGVGSITYEFRDREFATRFCELNRPATTEEPAGSP